MKETQGFKAVEEGLNYLKTDFFEEAEKIFEEAQAELRTASNLYLQDLETRKNNLSEQTEKIKTEVDKLTALSVQLKDQINDAVSRVKLDEAAELEEKYDKTNEKIEILKKKLAIAEGAELKGDKELYKAAKKAKEKAEKMLGEYKLKMFNMQADCKRCIKQLEEIEKTADEKNRFARLENYEYDRVWKHFNAKLLEEEARKRKEEEEQREVRRKLYIHA